MTIGDFLNRLHGVKSVADGWMALCPAHDDHNPSLHIVEGDDGRILITCHAGCSTESILMELGLTLADLFVTPKAKAKPGAAREKSSQRQIVATYDYRDEDGKLLFQTVRYRPKDFSQRKPDGGKGGWVWNLDGVRRVLYRLPELLAALAADPNVTVWLPEGEKDVDRLRALGLVATCNPLGSGSPKNNYNWRDEYSELLRGRRVAIPPDNDRPGRDHANYKAKALSGVASSVKMVELLGLPDKGDVSDWLDAGYSDVDLTEKAAKAPEWKPATSAAPQSKPSVDVVLSRIVTAQTILDTDYPEPKWAVKGLIPEGVTFIAGPPKLGKSIFALNIAVAVAESGKALSHFDVEQGSVLYLALEDGPRRVQARLRKLTKGRVSGLEVANEWPRLDQGGIEAIDAWIKSRGDARLLIVDTLKMLRPLSVGRYDRNVYDADYETIAPLTQLASQRIPLVIIHHTRKALADDPLATVSGSYGLTGAADGVLILQRSRNKSNATLSVIGRDVEEQELALEFKPNLFLWSVLGKADEVRRSGERREVLDLLEASEDTLSPGEMAKLLDRPPRTISALLWKMKNDKEIKRFGSKYQLPNYKPPARKAVKKAPKKSQKAKPDKNINASTVMNSTVDAQNANGDKRLDTAHQRINDVAQSDTAPEQDKGNGEVLQSVDALMRNAQPLHSQGLSASTAENINVDALMPQGDSARDRLLALREKAARNLTQRRRRLRI